jgi:hypothetical protein
MSKRSIHLGALVNTVITIGVVNRRNVDRKGLETFVKSVIYVSDTESS